ncbi:hypothetical protein UFOVP779_48 [uncultured Caudovirales phage]|uniref:Uncharacterized protein n=1 Tax=uncultured Caudovirales phage TaxID=2100421 RepID=A0A6J5P4Q7_9CAUD|nr:hypothetical protein UFOVP779_48 [uncultured Caudovirales phage]
MTNAKPTAPADRTNLKTWTLEQLTYAAPFWVAKLEKQKLSDLALVAYTPEGTQLWLDAIKISSKTLDQLNYWKLIAAGVGTFRVFPHSLRTHKRSASYDHTGLTKRHTKVGNWDKTLGLWG